MLAYLGSAVDRVLAVRANAFFTEGTHRPQSGRHLEYLRDAVRSFDPDLVFSINRAGIAEALLAVTRPDVKVLTVFVDYYDRLPDDLHRYGPRDLVWGTGSGVLPGLFRRKYADRLRQDQVLHTTWATDHQLFYPRGPRRATDIVFVGTPFFSEGFVSLLDNLQGDPSNREVFLDAYEHHRREYVYDWPGELRRRGFAYGSLAPHVVSWGAFEQNDKLQTLVCDQISGEARGRYLSALADMDLKIYGGPVRLWIQLCAMVDHRLFRRYQYRPVCEPIDLAQRYATAKIGLNLQHDHARHVGLSFRVFDLMACKTLLMTHVDTREALTDAGFVDGRDYVCFDSPESLRAKCRHYLAHERRRLKVVESAYGKVRAGHTLAHRFARVFGQFGYPDLRAHYQRLSGDDVREVLNPEEVIARKVQTLHRLPEAREAA
jgi:hypothetical protein